MNKIYNFIKKNSSWLIPAFGLLCLVCYCAHFILSLVQDVDGTTNVFDVLRNFLSEIFVYLVGVFMMIFGRAINIEINAPLAPAIIKLSTTETKFKIKTTENKLAMTPIRLSKLFWRYPYDPSQSIYTQAKETINDKT